MSSVAAKVFQGMQIATSSCIKTHLFHSDSFFHQEIGAKSKAKPKPKPKSDSAVKKMPRSTGIFKMSPVSPVLAQFLGTGETNRTDAVKEIWTYITKSHDLQNTANKREIFCDEKLKQIFDGKDKVRFLEITKLLYAHFVKTV